MAQPDLQLFYYDSCYFCRKVLSFASENKIKLNLVDVHADPANIKKLLDDTGRQTVPCLYIDGKPMHESDEIIDWLEKNLDNLEKAT